MAELDFSMKGVRNGPINTTFVPAPPVVFSSEPVIPVAAPAPVVEAVAPVEVAPVVEEVTPVVKEETPSDIVPDEVVPEVEAVVPTSDEDLVDNAILAIEARDATIAELTARVAELEGSIKVVENTAEVRRKRLESLVFHGKAIVDDTRTSTDSRKPAESTSAAQYTPTKSMEELNLLMN